MFQRAAPGSPICYSSFLCHTVAIELGSPGKNADLVNLEGEVGAHWVEQSFAKPHQAEFDPRGRFAVVPD
jgi:Lactonase, 7-bladed beta-propeller